jgi:hypothetical protein
VTARAAARTVAAYAHDVAEARQLLDMLGLLDEDGQLVELDGDAFGHGREGHDVVLHERTASASAAPAGLTALAASTLTLHREAAASVALDGETYVLDDVELVSISLPNQEPAAALPDAAPPAYAVHGDQPDEYSVAGITVDGGEVVHPQHATDQQVDDITPAPAGVVHRRDLLAEGLAHRDPAVVAVAQRALRNIDQLAELLLRRGGRR